MIKIFGKGFGTIDWESNDFTYGQRIELGEIFSEEETSEYYKLCKAFKVMYGYSRKWLPVRMRVRKFNGIALGLKGWIDKEREMLKYNPSSEEISAGIKELSEKVGNMSTIKQLAKAYSIDPDEVLKWSYAKVFAILYTDLEERKFEQKLNKNAHERIKRR